MRYRAALLPCVLVLALFGCGGGSGGGPTGLTEGTLEVLSSTTGSDPDPDGYTLRVDNGAPQPLSLNGADTVASLSTGTHTVTLAGVAPNCLLGGENPRDVEIAAASMTSLLFHIACDQPPGPGTETGSIQLTVTTGGLHPDPDGYTLARDGGAGEPISLSTTVSFSELLPGAHTFALAGVAPNCAVGANPTSVTVEAGTTVSATMNVTCTVPGHILFGEGDIVQINSDGTGLQRLTTGPAIDASPVWSRDGARIAFWSDRDGGGLYLMSSDGTGITRVTTDPSDSWPTWSPDGRRIAFYSRRDGDYEVYAVDDDGSHLTRLTNHPGFDGAPNWSPDGSKILFNRNDDSSRGLYLMNPDGTGITQLTDEDGDTSPEWSPDGSRIVFRGIPSDAFGGGTQIMVINADGTGRTNLTNNSHFNYHPTWSPAGLAVAYESEVEGQTRIWVMNADGTGATPISTIAGMNPSWGP